MRIKLNAKTATGARSEVRSKYPEGASLWGYDKDDVCVYITLVRPAGSKYGVATATREGKAIKFECEPTKSKLSNGEKKADFYYERDMDDGYRWWNSSHPGDVFDTGLSFADTQARIKAARLLGFTVEEGMPD